MFLTRSLRTDFKGSLYVLLDYLETDLVTAFLVSDEYTNLLIRAVYAKAREDMEKSDRGGDGGGNNQNSGGDTSVPELHLGEIGGGAIEGMYMLKTCYICESDVFR